MTDVTVADTGSAAAPASENAAPTPSDLGRMLASLRQKAQDAPAESADDATAEAPQELAAEANAAPAEEQATGETQEGDPAELPPLELPRSWTKEQAEHWNALPRATQEYLTEQASKSSAELRRVQNEAAEQRKVIETERAKAEQARQEYEAKLPALMEALQRQSQFSDIRTMDDVKKLQAEDPFRFQAWQLHQMEMQAVDQEAKQAESRKTQEKARQAQERKQREHSLLLEKAPEFADSAKLTAAQNAAVEYLRDKGFTDGDLAELAANPLSDDHRFQLLILDGLKYREAQKVKVAVKPVPPVQRPGAAKPPGAAARETIQNLSAKLERTGKTSDLAALIGGMRKGA